MSTTPNRAVLPRRRGPSSRRWLVCLALLPALGTVIATEIRADEGADLRRSPVVVAVEKARSAVVPIHTTQLIERRWMNLIVGPPIEGKGVGSGVIFHPDGYVITNAHVISRASKILVDVADASGGEIVTHEARIFAVDLANDLAILRLVPDTPRTYPYLAMGTSEDLLLGETVIALGNPFGIGLTVTTGVVGGLRRRLQLRPEEAAFDDFIQIDAAINPGNSGGALLDITGRWIGVNSAILNRATGAEGIGFALPVDRVRDLVARSFKRRLIRGDWTGLELESGPADEAVIRQAFPKGPGALAGLQPGDRVRSVNGVPTPTLFDFRWQLARLPRASVVRLEVVRGGRPLSEPVVVPLLPDPTDALSQRHLGFVGVDVDEESSLEEGLAFDAGVIVRDVLADGPAARIGIQPGDVVVSLGLYRIRNTDDLLIFLQYVMPGDLVNVRVLREVRRGGQLIGREGTEGALIAR